MPPKKAPAAAAASGGASSVKTATATGAKVTTTATGASATAGAPELLLEVPKGGKAGFLWADGGGVSKITGGGLADKSGVTEGWTLAAVDGKPVDAGTKKAAIQARRARAKRSRRARARRAR